MGRRRTRAQTRKREVAPSRLERVGGHSKAVVGVVGTMAGIATAAVALWPGPEPADAAEIKRLDLGGVLTAHEAAREFPDKPKSCGRLSDKPRVPVSLPNDRERPGRTAFVSYESTTLAQGDENSAPTTEPTTPETTAPETTTPDTTTQDPTTTETGPGDTGGGGSGGGGTTDESGGGSGEDGNAGTGPSTGDEGAVDDSGGALVAPQQPVRALDAAQMVLGDEPQDSAHVARVFRESRRARYEGQDSIQGRTFDIVGQFKGLDGQCAYVVWTLYNARTDTRIPGKPWLRNHRAIRWSISARETSGTTRFWVPLPPHKGHYYVIAGIYSQTGERLSYKRSPEFR
jgi:hypothetical protein